VMAALKDVGLVTAEAIEPTVFEYRIEMHESPVYAGWGNWDQVCAVAENALRQGGRQNSAREPNTKGTFRTPENGATFEYGFRKSVCCQQSHRDWV
jgi:hypothetical protein